MKYIDRKTKKIVEVKDQKILIFLYTTKLGRIILKITTKPIFPKYLVILLILKHQKYILNDL